MIDVLLIMPPFFTGNFPSYSLSLLKACLNKNKISSKILYANLFLKKKLLAFDYYERVCSSLNLSVLGEYPFSEYAFEGINKKQQEITLKYKNYKIEEVLNSRTTSINELDNIKSYIKDYLLEIKEIIQILNPIIIGFNITYSQITSSIAIAKLVKSMNKNIICVAGGYMCLPPMNQEILKLTNSIDYIFEGESENSFVDFIRNYLNKNILRENKIIPGKINHDLDKIPYPDYTDYFEQVKMFPLAKTTLLIETGRGCWWGEKKRCIFCGLPPNLEYRTKSKNKINPEIKYLINKYSPVEIIAVDNIINKNIKTINNHNKDVVLFYEVRPKLSVKELKYLKKNNIKNIQAGIESLDTKLLNFLKKGTISLNNILFLKNCRKLEINVMWNFLYNIPGEKEYHYNNIINLIDKIYHFQPPIKIIPFSIQRFSTAYNYPEQFQIKNIRPYEIIKDFFPDNADINNLSIYFKGDYESCFIDNKNLKNKFFDKINSWINNYNKSELTIKKLSSKKYQITDKRPISKCIEKNVNNKYYKILKILDNPQLKNEFEKYIKTKNLELEFNELLDNYYIILQDNYYLSIVIS